MVKLCVAAKFHLKFAVFCKWFQFAILKMHENRFWRAIHGLAEEEEQLQAW